MNFIEQYRGFWTYIFLLQECGVKVRPAHKVLYLGLFNIANETHWKSWFIVTKKQGLEYSGLAVGTYYKTLYDLEEWGLIKIKNKGNRHAPLKIKLTICVSKLILENKDRVSKLIHAYIKIDTRNQKSCIKIDTILKQEENFLKQGKNFSFKEEKKVLPPSTIKPLAK